MQCKYCDIPMRHIGGSLFECTSCEHKEYQVKQDNDLNLDSKTSYSNKDLMKRDTKNLDSHDLLKMEEDEYDSSRNNGGKTDYYNIDKSWKTFQDIIEARDMNYAQGNILKVACTFNLGRHEGTTYERELNKIIFFAERELKRISK